MTVPHSRHSPAGYDYQGSKSRCLLLDVELPHWPHLCCDLFLHLLHFHLFSNSLGTTIVVAFLCPFHPVGFAALAFFGAFSCISSCAIHNLSLIFFASGTWCSSRMAIVSFVNATLRDHDHRTWLLRNHLRSSRRGRATDVFMSGMIWSSLGMLHAVSLAICCDMLVRAGIMLASSTIDAHGCSRLSMVGDGCSAAWESVVRSAVSWCVRAAIQLLQNQLFAFPLCQVVNNL